MAIHVELRTTDNLELDEDDPLRQRIEELYAGNRVEGTDREEASYDFVYSDFPKRFLEETLGEHQCGDAFGLFCEFEAEEREFEYLYPVKQIIERLREQMPDVHAVVSRDEDGLRQVYAKVEGGEWDLRHLFVGVILDLCLRPFSGQPIFCIRW